MATVESKLLTAEEFHRLPDHGACELVRGRIVTMNQPTWRHGNIAARIAGLLDRYLEANNLGRITTNDSGIITGRNPDTVRGADVAFYSYARLPTDQDPDFYPAVAPEVVWEVMSRSDLWKDVLTKAAEYLEVGVLVVCVVDLKRQCFVSYTPDQPEVTLSSSEVWREPIVLPGFELPVDYLFPNT